MTGYSASNVLPNFKQPSDYSYAEHLNAAGQAWEYLRRNPHYVEAWNDYAALKAGLEQKYGLATTWSIAMRRTNPELLHYDPPLKPGETYAAWVERSYAEHREPVCGPHTMAYGKKWGLHKMLDPNKRATGKEVFLRQSAAAWYHASDIPLPEPDPGWGVIAYVAIDLRRPVSPQINVAKRDLLGFQRAQTKKGRIPPARTTRPPKANKNFTLHLRLLDGMRCGASKDEMAEAFFPQKSNEYPDYAGRKAVDEIRAQAERYRDKDYLSIVMRA